MIRLLSYNIRALHDDPVAVARVIRACRPDIVCLQEVPRFWGWRAQRDRLAGECGLVVASSRRSAGLAVLVRPQVRVAHSSYSMLTWSPPLHRRALALAVVELSGVRLVVASTHLDLAAGPRLRHVKEFLPVLAAARVDFRAPVVLAGDFNEEPGGASWTLLSRTFQDAYAVAPAGQELTFSAANPRERIDAVFLDRELRVVGCGVPDDPAGDFPLATDHRPLLAEFDRELTAGP
ncbi:MAG: endonuclease/exonuclease/phosphatase family protein [Streptosporangiaceae bacterium]